MSRTVRLTEQYVGPASYITREDPALLLLLTLAAHPNLTLDYNRMSVMSRMLPEAMWTTNYEIAANMRSLVQLADMVQRADSMTVDDLEHIELEQARLRSSTGAGYGRNGKTQHPCQYSYPLI